MTFHRDWNASKSCPGKAITKEWILKNLNGNAMEKDFVKAVEAVTGEKYGDNLNENEQKDAAKRMMERLDENDEEKQKLNEIIGSQKSGLDQATAEIEELSKRPESCPEYDTTGTVQTDEASYTTPPIQYIEVKVPAEDLPALELLRRGIRKFLGL
jgi:uncharacterized protein YPO0396